jgi:outer membrane protein assembly factor BamE (lipoprotein component of BamABCDE complex)
MISRFVRAGVRSRGAAASSTRRHGAGPRRRPTQWLAAVLVAGALASCAPMVHTDGQIPDPVKLASIQLGVQTQEEVAEMLGTPSSVGTFDPNTWYYISKRTSTTAFLEPDVLEQRVVVINFDESGVVRGMRLYGLNDATEISPVGRSTPTKGKELTVLDQMIGNLNRYSAR